MDIFEEIRNDFSELLKKQEARDKELAEKKKNIRLTNIKTICAYCQTTIREVIAKTNFDMEVVSHGMCQSCFENEVYLLGGKELRAFVDKHKQKAA